MRPTKLLSLSSLVLGAVLLAGAGCTSATTTTTNSTVNNNVNTAPTKADSIEPLSYSATGVPVSVLKNKAVFDLTADQLQNNATDCGSQHETGYFSQLVAKFNSATMLKYDFKYTGASQTADTFKVTLIPNTAGYTSLDQFKNDWDICAAGGSLYPTMLNADWLLFENSCGSGLDDGLGLTIGCDVVKKVVGPSLQLNTIK